MLESGPWLIRLSHIELHPLRKPPRALQLPGWLTMVQTQQPLSPIPVVFGEYLLLTTVCLCGHRWRVVKVGTPWAMAWTLNS